MSEESHTDSRESSVSNRHTESVDLEAKTRATTGLSPKSKLKSGKTGWW